MEGRPFMTGIIVGAVAGAAGRVLLAARCSAPDGKTVIGAVVLRILADPDRPHPARARRSGDERIPFLVDDDGVIVWHPNEKLLYSSLVPLRKETLDEIVADQRFRRQKIDTVEPARAGQGDGRRQAGRQRELLLQRSPKREEIAGLRAGAGHRLDGGGLGVARLLRRAAEQAVPERAAERGAGGRGLRAARACSSRAPS